MNRHSPTSRHRSARPVTPDARKAVRRPAVPGKDEQRLDTDYDPDPALDPTPLKNASARR